MLLQFKHQNSLYFADTEELVWCECGAPPIEGKFQEVRAQGSLVSQHFGVFALEGRKPPNLATFGTYLVPVGQTLFIYLRANVPVVDFSMPKPIKEIRYEIAPEPPRQMQSQTRHGMQVIQGGKSTK